jgi:putative FmdB family regulatory protein
MPLYEYQCDSCGHRFEVIQKFSDPPPEACPRCHGTVRKLVSSPAFQFKGSGWYVTDYARKSDAAQGDGKGAGESKEAAKDSKPASGEASGTDSKAGNTESGPSTPAKPS